MVSNKVLERFAWGIFIISIGAGWFVEEYYRVELGRFLPFTVGLILIGLNIARASTGIRISKGSLGIGIVCFVIGGAGILGYSLPLVPTIVMLIGLFIIAEARQKLTIN